MQMVLPPQVSTIMKTLQAAGYEAYAVGGCVRDMLLSREPEDWDITTSAMPEVVKGLFPRTFDTGIAHGTVTVLIEKTGYEVTTYRLDGIYEDHRHPKQVTFTRSLREDLIRRDFTINAMAYNEREGLIDHFGGQKDLATGVIRCVGNAHDRFGEDALRILRALRFSAQLDFAIQQETEEAMRERAQDLQQISAERIQTELIKTVVSPHPEMIRKAYELGITKVILPEFDRIMKTTQETPHHCYTVGEHTIKAMQLIRADKILRLTMLLHDMGKPDRKTMGEDGVAHFKKHALDSEELAHGILRRLKFDNDTVRKVTKLVRFHDERMPATPQNVRRAMNRIGVELFPLYNEVRRADVLAQSAYLREEKLANLEEVEEQYRRILAQKECVTLKDLAVTGSDLLAAGIAPGPEIGNVLQRMLQDVLEYPEHNTREYLLELLSCN